MTQHDPKYPDITVVLTNEDGNALSLVGAVRREMRRNRVPQEELVAFSEEALSGDYDNVIQTCCKWVNVE